ncbi:hypothetical protein COBT_004090, partial [Conglomerata obtusa]
NKILLTFLDNNKDKITSSPHVIKINNSPLIKRTMYRQGFKIDKIIKEKVEELLKNNIIKKSKSSYAIQVVLVPKPNDDYRFRIDYMELIKTKQD